MAVKMGGGWKLPVAAGVRTVVAGIAGMGDSKAVGRIGGKALAWFITASLASLLLGLLFANLLQPGASLALPLPDKDAATNLKTGGLNLREFIAHVFPASFFQAMATNEILQILVFSCFFGFAIASLPGSPAKTITAFITELVPVMLKVTDFVMWFAPAGVFGAVAAAITVQGLGVLVTYADVSKARRQLRYDPLDRERLELELPVLVRVSL